MKIAAVCPTYKRPQLLERAIQCFLEQTHPERELVILDDAGQYADQEGEGWRLLSIDKRFEDFGRKRNAVIDMVSDDVDAILCWDDDDVYWPHAMESVAKALEKAVWAQPRLVYETHELGILQINPAFGKHPLDWGYGGSWAWRLDAFWTVGGYPPVNDGDDRAVALRLHQRYGTSADSTEDGRPWYWYNRDPGVIHIDQQGSDFWKQREAWAAEHVEILKVGWNGPNVCQFPVIPGIHRRPW